MANEPAQHKAMERFPESKRLVRHSDFERVYKQGKRHFATHVTVFYLLRQSGEGPRVGLTVGKALGGAVQRNRMKRRLREVVRLNWVSPRIPVDVVINPKRSLLTADFGELEKDIIKAFSVIEKSAKAV